MVDKCYILSTYINFQSQSGFYKIMAEKKAELKPTNASDHRCIPPDVPGFPGYRKDIYLTKDDFRLIGRTRKKKYVFN